MPGPYNTCPTRSRWKITSTFSPKRLSCSVNPQQLHRGDDHNFRYSRGGLAAYSLGRLTYRGRNLILILILAVSMFPPLALLPSLFNMFLELRMINSYSGLIIGHAGLYTPIAIWILTNFFKTVPHEIEDAARVDGASSLRIFWSIILPLSAPGLISTGLIAERIPASLVLMSDNFMRTAPVGISLFPGEYSFPWEIHRGDDAYAYSGDPAHRRIDRRLG